MLGPVPVALFHLVRHCPGGPLTGQLIRLDSNPAEDPIRRPVLSVVVMDNVSYKSGQYVDLISLMSSGVFLGRERGRAIWSAHVVSAAHLATQLCEH